MRTPTVVRQSWGSKEVRAMLPSPNVEQVPFPIAKGVIKDGDGGDGGAPFEPSDGGSSQARM